MTDEDIFALIDSCFADCTQPRIGFSGGEAFLYFDRLCRILRYATSKGALVSVNTNGFWGRNFDDAVTKVRILKGIPVHKLVLSMDDFHEEFINRENALNVVTACKQEHLEIELQFVATRTTSRLGDLLNSCGDRLLNITCREIPCHPVGRAEEMIRESDLFTSQAIPTGRCPSSILSVSAYGKLMPCCNTASHLPSLQLGTIRDEITTVHRRFQYDPTLSVMRSHGPHALLEAAVAAGYEHPEGGYLDQCHLCYCLFKDATVTQAIREGAQAMVEKEFMDEFLANYTPEDNELETTNA